LSILYQLKQTIAYESYFLTFTKLTSILNETKKNSNELIINLNSDYFINNTKMVPYYSNLFK
jgi:hypothetical protein